MFDFDAGKLVIIGIVALVVIGPKELPRVLRYVGQTVGKMRRLAADFQAQFMEAMKEADVADIKADVAKLAESAKLDVNFNPIYDLKTQITDAVHGSQADAMPATADVPAIAAPESQSQADLPGSIGDAAEAGLAPVAEVKPAPGVEAPSAFAPPEPAPHAPVPHAAEPAPLRNSA